MSRRAEPGYRCIYQYWAHNWPGNKERQTPSQSRNKEEEMNNLLYQEDIKSHFLDDFAEFLTEMGETVKR